MTHEYTVNGMTCESCEAKVKSKLLSMPHVLSAEVSNTTNTAVIEMDKHIPLADFQQALGGETSKYKISATKHSEATEQVKGWLETYRPILLIFGYILGVALLIELVYGSFAWMRWMNHFMAGFFLVFSFFKFLNLKGFAESYAMYDIIAKRWKDWGNLYAFTELALGLAFLTGLNPMLTNAVTFVVMTISIIGVLQGVLNKRKIQCACLGTVFNLPMSTITIIEDALMIGMSGIILITMK
jgi:cation transport ATPase